MSHPIPSAALDDRLGFLGTSGSGKTYNAGVAVERLLKRNSRVVIVDPLGVWWGLRLLADGKKSSPYDVAIFGGPHGDLPLNEHAGALIGETAATMAESCIIDLSELGAKRAERHFMTAFLEAIYRKAGGEPFHLVVDEADLFAPQKPQKGEEVLLGLMESIVRRGRVKGFIPWLISQRPAVLNKNVLSQVAGLIAFKLTASQDRDALDAWIEGQADKKQGKEIKDALPAMQIGQGIVWLPSHDILKTATFPQKETFDSSRTPKRGEKKKKAKALKPLDLGALKDRLAAVVAETKANDPKALKSEVFKLQSQVKQLTAKASAEKPVDPNAIREAEKRGFEQAKKKLGAAADVAFKKAVAKVLTSTLERVGDFGKALAAELKTAIAGLETPSKLLSFTPPVVSVPRVATKSPKTLRVAPPQQVAGDGTFTAPQMRILRSISMWKALGNERPSRAQVAAVAGYSFSSGGFGNLLGGLATAGAIVYPSPGFVSLNVEGIETMTREEGAAMLMSVLSNPQKKIIGAVLNGEVHDRAAVADASGYSATSGGFGNLLGSLSTLGLITYPSPGQVQVEPWVQELLADVRMAA